MSAVGWGNRKGFVVVIPALNEALHIADCIGSIAVQTLRPLEIVLVDGLSDDGTIEVAQRAAKQADIPLRVLRNESRRVPAGLNLFLSQVDVPMFVRIDAHAMVNPEYCEMILSCLELGYAGAGGIKVAVGETPQGRANAAALTSRLGVGGSSYHYATSVAEVDHIPYGAYQSQVAADLGGWNESLFANQDFEFDYRLRLAGHKLLLDPRAKIFWRCRATIRGQFLQYRRYGSGKARVLRLHPKSASARHAAPFLLLLALVSSVLLMPFYPLVAVLPIGYVVAIFALCRLGAPGRLGVGRIRLACSLLAMHVGFGVGLVEGFVGRPIPRSQIGGADGS